MSDLEKLAAAWNSVPTLPPIEFSEDEAASLIGAVVSATLKEAAQACIDQQEVFLSPLYATGQPMSSFHERFACGRCAGEILALTPSSRREGL